MFPLFHAFYRVNNISSQLMITTSNLECSTLYEFIFCLVCQICGGSLTFQKNLCTIILLEEAYGSLIPTITLIRNDHIILMLFGI